MNNRSDQEKFELRVVKAILPKYRKHWKINRSAVEHVDDLRRLSALDMYGRRTGGFKQTSPMNLGALLNSFRKTAVRVRLDAFLEEQEALDSFTGHEWEFVFSIPSSTAMYVILPVYDAGLEYIQHGMARFISFVPHNGSVLCIMRLDDYVNNVKWPVDDE